MDAELAQYVDRRARILDEVRQVLVTHLHVRLEADEIDPDAPLFGTGLGLDSVDAVELVVALEAQFDIKLPEDTSMRRIMRTVGSLVDLVCQFRLGTGPERIDGEAPSGA